MSRGAEGTRRSGGGRDSDSDGDGGASLIGGERDGAVGGCRRQASIHPFHPSPWPRPRVSSILPGAGAFR